MIAGISLGSFELENVYLSWVWLWLLLVAAVAFILVATYRGIFQRSERRLTWVLMGLRGVGLFALLLALAKPSWTGETHLVDAGRVAVIVDNSESMSLPDPSGKSRYTLAVEAAEKLRKALEADRGKGRLVVDFFDINGKPFPGNRLPDRPAVPRTDLTQALTGAASGMRVKRLNGVVLISDGMDNAGQEDFREFAQTYGAPIYTVGFKDTRSLGDFSLAVTPLRQPPKRVLVNNDVQVEVLVSKTGGPKTDATVVIQRGLDDRFTQKKISLPEGKAEQAVSLTFRPTQPGKFEFTAAVELGKGRQGLARNNWRFPLQVDAERIRVLYIEGFLRPEYTFLKRGLENDPDLKVAAFVRKVNPQREESKRDVDLLTSALLKEFEVVILGDMEANYLSNTEYDALVAWLDRKDKDKPGEHSLLVLGGYHSFGRDGFGNKKNLARLLPVDLPTGPATQSETPFRLQLTEEGRAHAIFQMSGDRVRTEDVWKQAPPLAGCCLVGKAKPLAQVLAVHPRLKVGGKPAVVAAVQPCGAGHTMLLTADTTWYWSRLPVMIQGRPDTLYTRFWGQTVRWLAGRTVDDKKQPLTVSTDSLGYDTGKPVTVTVVRNPNAQADLSKATLQVAYKLVGSRGKTAVVPVKNSSAQPDIFTGVFYPAVGEQAGASGRYEVNAGFIKSGKMVANQGAEFMVYGSNQELQNTGTNSDNLRMLSENSRPVGAFYEVADAEKLAPVIPRKQREIRRTQHTEFWNSPWLFVFFIGAVSAEWFVRRRSHLI